MKEKLILMSLVLGACNFSPAPGTTQLNPNASKPNPSAPQTVLGTLEVNINSLLKTGSLEFRPGGLSGQSGTPRPNAGLSLVAVKPISVITDGPNRYINSTFQLKNVSGSAFNNLTLYAYSKESDGAVGGTALKLINALGGLGTDPAAARQALPTQGTLLSGGMLSLDPNGDSFQAFDAADAQNVQNLARLSGIIAPIDSVLDYGFTAKACANVDCSSITPEGRNIAVNSDGKVTLAIRVPSTGTPNDDFRFSMTFVVADDSVKKVTRSVYPPEDLAAAQARANAASATLVQVGSGQLIVNPRISTQPSFLLPATCDSSAPALTQRIPAIQGSGSSTPFVGSQTTEGVVTAVFPGLNGFFLQDKAGDGDASTSDGIFVLSSSLVPSSGSVGVALGDFVRVSGTVAESFTQTQIGGTVSVYKCSRDSLPALSTVNFPLTNSQADLEKFEGMRIKIPDTLAVTEHFNLDRFGELLLASSGPGDQSGTDIRLEQFTQFNAPSVAGNAAHLVNLAKRKLLIDDGSNTQYPPFNPYGRGGNPLTASNTLRGGDTVTGIEGVLGYSFSNYRFQPTAPLNFQPTNPRPTLPISKNSATNLRVASLNVLNFFTTLNPTTTTTFALPAPCTGTIQPRGANTAEEFTRQKAKTVAAIRAINADVQGVIEMQNNGFDAASAIQDLVTSLNAGQPASDQYTIAPNPTNGFGCDAIKVAFIYKSASVRIAPGTTVASLPLGASNPGFTATGRAPLAISFEQLDTGGAGTGKVFTAVMDHFKSKGSSAGGVGDADALDGQGQSNGTRTRSANELVTWLATNPTGVADTDYVLLGDFNAYAKEDPLTLLAGAGYPTLIPETEYSYVFDGQWGSLDHALGTSSLNAQKVQAGKLHINADEPDALDYNTQLDPSTNPSTNNLVIKTAQQQIDLYAPDAFRASDHDGVYVDLNLTGGTVVSQPPTLTGASSASGRILVPSSGPAYVSGVLSDPTDPASVQGLNFTVPSALATVTASSSNTTVVPASGLNVSGTGTNRTLKITPSSVGFSNITVTVTEGTLSSSYTVGYAASAASSTPSTSRFFTEHSDASTAQDVGGGFMLVGDDEDQKLRLYDRANSGLPVTGFDYTSSLNLTQLSGGLPREIDIEASARVGGTLYWMGSLSNKSDTGADRPNRNRVFATTLSGTGSSSSLSFAGFYKFLREDLAAWDSNNGHGLGANYLGLSASTATGKPGEGSDGFNLEGLSMAPGSTNTALLAFRAPLEDTVNRNKALVVPVTNFTALPVAGGGTAGTATFGAPIVLDLGGRGIREIKCSTNLGEGCFILAGPFGSGTNFALYSWSGVATDAAQFRQDLSSLATESQGSLESIVALPGGNLTSSAVDGLSLQLLSDNGDTNFYNESPAVAAKDQIQNNFKKFRSDTITVSSVTGPVACTVQSVTVAPSSASVNVGATTPLTATVNAGPAGCTGTVSQAINWSSSDTSKATVSASGVVSGVAAGSANITATSSTDTSKSGSSSVSVNAVVSGNLPFGAAFTAGNVVIYRVGDGVAALSGNATAAFLDEYTPQGTLVQSKALPIADNGTHQTLTNSGSAASEGQLTRSSDGKCLVFAGYDAALGTASVASASGINRVVGVVFNGTPAVSNATLNTTTVIPDGYTGNNIRSATSTDCTNLWTSGTGTGGGVRYTTLGGNSSTQVSTTVTNTRNVGIFGGQLFVSSSSGAFRLATVGTGTPTTAGQTITNLGGFPTLGTSSPYGFFFADLDTGVAGLDTVYVADDASGAGIQKWSLNAGTWTLKNTVALSGARGLTGVISGSNVTLYATTQTALFSLTDSSGYNANLNGTLSAALATVGTSAVFRGIALTPNP